MTHTEHRPDTAPHVDSPTEPPPWEGLFLSHLTGEDLGEQGFRNLPPVRQLMKGRGGMPLN